MVKPFLCWTASWTGVSLARHCYVQRTLCLLLHRRRHVCLCTAASSTKQTSLLPSTCFAIFVSRSLFLVVCSFSGEQLCDPPFIRKPRICPSPQFMLSKIYLRKILSSSHLRHCIPIRVCAWIFPTNWTHWLLGHAVYGFATDFEQNTFYVYRAGARWPGRPKFQVHFKGFLVHELTIFHTHNNRS